MRSGVAQRVLVGGKHGHLAGRLSLKGHVPDQAIVVRSAGGKATTTKVAVLAAAVGLCGVGRQGHAACAAARRDDRQEPVNQAPKRPRTGATDRHNNGGKDDEDDAVTKLIDLYGPQLGDAGFGGLLGFCSGYALLKIGRAVAFAIGASFIAAQTLSHLGYVDLKWKSYLQIEDATMGLLDQDGNHSLGKEDAKLLWKRLKRVLKSQLPSGGGFATGFAIGIVCA